MPALPKATLGRTGLHVARLGYGAMALAGPSRSYGKPFSEAQARGVLEAALLAGINFIDTSPSYGVSEETIGKMIGSRRTDYYLATKCGSKIVSPDPHSNVEKTWDPDYLTASLDTSLRRLRTGYVDLLQLHNPTPEDVETHACIDTLLRLKDAGKARFLGISTTLPHLDHFLQMNAFDTFQLPYSALEREHEDAIRRVADAGCGTIIRGGVARGAASFKHKPGPFVTRWDAWQQLDLADLLGGMEPTEFVLRFTLSHPHVHTVIVGTLNPLHFAANIRAACAGPLPPDLYAEARRRLNAVGEQ